MNSGESAREMPRIHNAAYESPDLLYDRCSLLHTIFIPDREFERVLGIHGIDAYTPRC